jgi:transcriptional regulator with XRE-family HTH domain
MIRHVNDQQIGGIIRAVRIRRRWRQRDLASRANVSQTMISRIERGHLGGIQLDVIRRVCAALEIRVELDARWRGGELDRLRNARHSALHEKRGEELRAAASVDDRSGSLVLDVR